MTDKEYKQKFRDLEEKFYESDISRQIKWRNSYKIYFNQQNCKNKEFDFETLVNHYNQIKQVFDNLPSLN